MINYRNIGHDWQFSQTQEIQLDQYCNANVLLVDCLNPAFSISPSVREEIEASLFLPISEIEQNLPNQAQR
jgi:predicted NACHT family NTPase